MENNIDKLFNKKLGNDSTLYDPAAWGRMAALIDEDDDINGNEVLTPRKSNWKKYISLALLLLVALVGFWQFNTASNTKTSFNVPANDKESWDALNSDENKVTINGIDRDDDVDREYAANEIDNQAIKRTNKLNEMTNGSSTIENPKNSDIENKTRESKSVAQTNTADRLSRDYVRSEREGSNVSIYNNESTSTVRNISDKTVEDSRPSVSEMYSSEKLNGSRSNSVNQNTTNDEVIYKEPATNNADNIEGEISKEISSIEKVMESNKADIKYEEVSKNTNLEEKPSIVRGEVPVFPFLESSTQELSADYKEIVPLMTEVNKNGRFELGIYSTLAVNQGFISQTGLSINYRLNPEWSILTGLGFDYADYDNGPQVTVTDKVYSFGSTLVDRSLVLNKRTSINIPFVLNRKFDRVSIFAGIDVNYHLAGNGTSDDGEENLISFWVTDDVFNNLAVNYQIGAAYRLNRQLGIQFGLSYRNSLFTKDVSSTDDNGRIYPTVGFNYIIAKY